MGLHTQVSEIGLDFTSVSPHVSCQEHRYIYATCGAATDEASPPQGVVKIDVQNSSAEQKWLPEPHEWLGESIFAPRQHDEGSGALTEDDGYLLNFMFDG